MEQQLVNEFLNYVNRQTGSNYPSLLQLADDLKKYTPIRGLFSDAYFPNNNFNANYIPSNNYVNLLKYSIVYSQDQWSNFVVFLQTKKAEFDTEYNQPNSTQHKDTQPNTNENEQLKEEINQKNFEIVCFHRQVEELNEKIQNLENGKYILIHSKSDLINENTTLKNENTALKNEVALQKFYIADYERLLEEQNRTLAQDTDISLNANQPIVSLNADQPNDSPPDYHQSTDSMYKDLRSKNANELQDTLITDGVTISQIFGCSNGGYFRNNDFTKFMAGYGDWLGFILKVEENKEHQRQFLTALRSLQGYQSILFSN